MGAAVICWL